MAFYNSRVPAFGEPSNMDDPWNLSSDRPSSNGSSGSSMCMPLKKRYTKSHQFDFAAGGCQSTAANVSGGGFNSGFDFSSNSSSSSSSGYSSSEEDKGCDSPLDFSAAKNVVRAGVIRHSSQPQKCLAYYYLEK